MSLYTNIRDIGRGYPGTSVFLCSLAVAAGIVSFYAGKREQRKEPVVRAVVLIQKDLNQDGRSPDGALEFLSKNTPRKSLYMQPDGRTLLTYEGLERHFQGIDDSLNFPRQSQRTGTSTQLNPLDDPYNIMFAPASTSSSAQPGASAAIPPPTTPATQPYVPAQPVAPPASGPALPPPANTQPLLPPASAPAQPGPTVPQPPLPPASGPVQPAPNPATTPSSTNNYDSRTSQLDRTAYNNQSELERRAEVEHAPAVNGLVPVVRPSQR